MRKLGRTILTEDESKQVLACYGIPVCQTLPARSADEAANLAVKMGFPVKPFFFFFFSSYFFNFFFFF